MRNVLASALAILGVCALTACAHKAEGPKIDPSLDTLVPSDTVLMAGTRLEALLKTPIYQRNFANRQFSQIDEFAQRTGLDPRKDLWELLFVSNGKSGVLLGRGKFADEMMAPRASPGVEEMGGKRFGYKGFTLFGNERNAVLLFNGSTAAVGETPAIEALVDHRETAHGPPPAMAALLQQIPPDAQFWGAYAGGPVQLPIDPNSNLANINKLLASVRTGTLYFDLRAGINGVAEAICADEQSAQQVQAAIKALIGIGRLSVPKNQPELAQVYDTLRVTQESTRVKLYIDVPDQMADRFLKMWMGGR